MDSQFEQLIEVNVSGRVFAICHSCGISDPSIITHYIDILRQAVWANLSENCNPEEFSHVLDEQSKWLESEVAQTRPKTTKSPTKNDEIEEIVNSAAKPPEDMKEPEIKPSGYVPKAKSMPERLADERVGMEQLLTQDCITLKLITPSQAAKLKRRLLGQEPKKAEQELVAELRNSLHQQVRMFIRKHEGGPWATATLQNELRMDIAATRSLRSLVNLARELLMERDGWLKKNKVSLTSRLFGGKIRFSK